MKNQKVTICAIALLGLLFYSKFGDKPKEPKPPRPKPSIGFHVPLTNFFYSNSFIF
jgi:hypothetical protein